jgi:hypothetical protein
LKNANYDVCRISETRDDYLADTVDSPDLSVMSLKVWAIILGAIKSSGDAQEAIQMTVATKGDVQNVVEAT